MSPPENVPRGRDENEAIYTIETVARITRIPEEEIVIYHRTGVISSTRSDGSSQLLFDETAVHQLRRVSFLLSEYEMNPAALKLVSSLLQEIETLRAELRFLREKN